MAKKTKYRPQRTESIPLSLLRFFVFLLVVWFVNFLSTGLVLGYKNFPINLDFSGSCELEGANGEKKACFLTYGSQEINTNLQKAALNQPIEIPFSIKNWQSSFNIPINLFDKKLCFDLKQPSQFIAGVEIKLNSGSTLWFHENRKCDIALTKDGETIFRIEKLEINYLNIDQEDQLLLEIMNDSLNTNFEIGEMKMASQMNSIIYASVRLQHPWFVFFISCFVAANLIFVFLELVKFILKGTKSFLE